MNAQLFQMLENKWLANAVTSDSLYPSGHGTDAAELRRLFRANGVLLVEMGHTHYNELANDGHIVSATTRSTGQIEEGPAGFSVTTLNDGVVGWKFKPIGEWPLVIVTSPSDQRLIINPDFSQERGGDQVARALVPAASALLPTPALGAQLSNEDMGRRERPRHARRRRVRNAH
jgi:hypothetical protein